MNHLRRQFVSGLSLTMITLDLLFWIPALVIVALLKVISNAPLLMRLCDWLVDRIYRAAVWFDHFWLTRILGIKFHVTGDLPCDPDMQCIVISNHRSWFDILILQSLVVRRGPLLMFLIKQELIYVPVVGWICLALNFPRLYRGKSDTGRDRDYAEVASATQRPGALMNFVEGTRFTPEKQALQNSEYQHLLRPRSGGFRIMLQNLPEAPVYNVTLVYPEDGLTFWRCLCGEHRHYDIFVDTHQATEIATDPAAWLSQRWQEKDALIAQSRALRRQEDIL